MKKRKVRAEVKLKIDPEDAAARIEVAEWLRLVADNLENDGQMYASKFKAKLF